MGTEWGAGGEGGGRGVDSRRDRAADRQTDRSGAVELWDVHSQVRASGRTLVLTSRRSVSHSLTQSLGLRRRRAGTGRKRNREKQREIEKGVTKRGCRQEESME